MIIKHRYSVPLCVLLVSQFLYTCSLLGTREETFSFDSATTGKQQTVYVYHPEDYTANTPAIYLLNGWGAPASAWGSGIDLVKQAEDRGLIFVSLTAGENQYTNSFIDSSSRYADFVLEVAEKVEDKYGLDLDWQKRALCGISNGGGGAVYVLSLYPEWFAAAGCLSGTVYSRINYPGLAERSIRIDVGTGDTGIIDDLRSLRDALEDNEINHAYFENPGGHNWDFWSRYAPAQFDYLQDIISSD